MALTDHDTLDGLEEASQAGEKLGLRVIRGVELGAKEYFGLHILGYGFSVEALKLRELCSTLRQGRDERKYRIIAFLSEKEIDLSLAKKYQLHVTGGSDFHGERVKPNIQLAALRLDLDW